MDNKVIKILTNWYTHGIIAAIFSILFLLQEIRISEETVNVWFGIVFIIPFGFIAEFFRKIAIGDKYNFKNIIPWIVGGIIGCTILHLLQVYNVF